MSAKVRAAACAVAIVMAGVFAACASTDGRRRAAPASPCLQLETAAGTIAIELSRPAAPRAVATIEGLARGPIWNLDLVPAPDAARAAGYFDGLSFDYARPRLELRLPARAPAAAFTIEAELDATALGLDTERVADAGEAMDLLQMQLLPALRRPNRERTSTSVLEAWARRFEIDHDPGFLVGTTRQEVLEAMGYRFRRGLATLPANRGAVALVPAAPTTAELSLAILLADHPARTGRWVIVGRVVDGLELADEISLRPLAEVALRDYRPRHPVPVERAVLIPTCKRAPEGALP